VMWTRKAVTQSLEILEPDRRRVTGSPAAGLDRR